MATVFLKSLVTEHPAKQVASHTASQLTEQARKRVDKTTSGQMSRQISGQMSGRISGQKTISKPVADIEKAILNYYKIKNILLNQLRKMIK